MFLINCLSDWLSDFKRPFFLVGRKCGPNFASNLIINRYEEFQKKISFSPFGFDAVFSNYGDGWFSGWRA